MLSILLLLPVLQAVALFSPDRVSKRGKEGEMEGNKTPYHTVINKATRIIKNLLQVGSLFLRREMRRREEARKRIRKNRRPTATQTVVALTCSSGRKLGGWE